MIIFPAIDLKEGKVVRLTQGDYDQMEVYSDNPVEIAEQFEAQGATHLHVVDLDGAKAGYAVNEPIISEIVKNTKLFVEVGGGIRREEQIGKYLSAGVRRVILGSAAVTDFSFVEEMVERYGGSIAVGVDAKDGCVAIHGWQEGTKVGAFDFCKTCAASGVSTVIFTDIEKDGKLEGTNLEIYRKLCKIRELNMIASGGISRKDELVSLQEMGIYGAIVGKAIYTGTLDLRELIKGTETARK